MNGTAYHRHNDRRAIPVNGDRANGNEDITEGGAMTAPTPEQMRALADRIVPLATTTEFEAETIAALRAAADQLEAVHDVDRIASAIKAYKDSSRGPSWNEFRGDPPMRADYDTARCVVAALTADTAPQEERISECDWPECPVRPKSLEKHEIESGPELHSQCKDAILLVERARREGWRDIDGNETHR